MLQQLGFIPQHQFHVLINLANEEHNLTVLPNQTGRFKIIEQGKVLGELQVTPQNECVCSEGKLKKSLINELEQHIKSYYSRFKGLLSQN